ncbi:MAG: glycoside hydrolase, partial [Actinomycetota bacterium]|nr:glycoside hydrolase [Actinomycetota bacterium]
SLPARAEAAPASSPPPYAPVGAAHGTTQQPEVQGEAATTWAKRNLELAAPMGVLGDDVSPNEVVVERITPSPAYRQDRTVFASARLPQCVELCWVLLRSTDGAATWHRLPGVGFGGGEVILPTAYPDDGRIFARGLGGFQVSEDGGGTFRSVGLVSAAQNNAVMSPAFSSGDGRILLPDPMGMEYDDRVKGTVPVRMSPLPPTVSGYLSFAFPGRYDPADPVVFVAGSLPQATPPLSSVAGQGVVARCEGARCGEPVPLPGVLGTPMLLATGDSILAWTPTQQVFRIASHGSSLVSASAPRGLRYLSDMFTDRHGTVFAVGGGVSGRTRMFRSTDSAASWQEVPTDSLPTIMIGHVVVLDDGTFLVAMDQITGGFACSHDQGRTWAPHC